MPTGTGEPELLELVPLSSSGTSIDAINPPHGRVLRATLAMRGGVSLAVWIGGAVAELDLWRRIRLDCRDDGVRAVVIDRDPQQPCSLTDPERERLRHYATALHRAKFDRVEFDVLAGASAGGLNAVLYAVAQRSGSSVDVLRDVWLDAGSAWRLLRLPHWKSVESFLRGDEYFWPKVLAALRSSYTAGNNPAHCADRVTVELSATVIDGGDSTEQGTQDGRGHFRFIGCDSFETDEDLDRMSTKRRDIPGRDCTPADRDFALARLALAARTTSSFPGAFEPALVHSITSGDGEAIDEGEGRVDMSFAFHAHRDGSSEIPTRPFRVVDGGVLDNAPIDRAMRSIRATPSDVNAERALVYLDPRPQHARVDATTALPYGTGNRAPSLNNRRHPDRASRFLHAVLEGVARRGIRESANDEVADIERVRLDLMLADGRRESSAAVVKGPWFYVRGRARAAYLRYRSTADPALLSRVLSEPSVWQLGTDLNSRRTWRAWSPRERDQLLFNFLDTIQAEAVTRAASDLRGSPSDVDPSMTKSDDERRHALCVAWGPQALHDASRCVISWIRTLEQAVGEPWGTQSSRYSLPLALPSETDGACTMTQLRRGVYNVLIRSGRMRDNRIAAALDASNHLTGELRAIAFLNEIHSLRPEDWTTLVEQWEILDRSFAMLRRVSPDGAAPPQSWGQSQWSKIPRPGAGFHVWDLPGFGASSGIPEPVSRIRFWAITGDERPAHWNDFTRLIERMEDSTARSLLRLRPLDRDAIIDSILDSAVPTADQKLAGTSLANFAGFVCAKWRANDWLWGRLDASASMVRFIYSLEEVASTTTHLTAASRAEARSKIDAAVRVAQNGVFADALAESISIDDSRTPFLYSSSRISNSPANIEEQAKAGRERLALGMDDLESLVPKYRLALLSRFVRLLGRALKDSFAWAPIVAPVLVSAPLLLNPARQALALAVIGLMAILLARSYESTRTETITEINGVAEDWLVWAVCGIVVAIHVVRSVIAISQVMSVKRRVAARSRQSTDRAYSTAVRARVTALTYYGLLEWSACTVLIAATIGVATVGATWMWSESTGPSMPYWVLVITAIVLSARSLSRLKLPRAGTRDASLFALGLGICAVWVLFVALCLAEAKIPYLISLGPWAVPSVVAGAAFALGVIHTWGWLPIVGQVPGPDGNLRRCVNGRTSTVNWLLVSLFAGVGTGAVVWLVLQLPAPAGFNVFLAALLGTYSWATLIWWLPEIPAYVDRPERPYTEPSRKWTLAEPRKERRRRM